MTDPAVAYLPNSDYEAYNRGEAKDVWLKAENGTEFLGVVWPGEYARTVPDVCYLMLLIRCDRFPW